jgi:hypothetical protein
MAWTPAFHTRQLEEPKVFHDRTGCPVGRKIAPRDFRAGVGDGRRRCELCAALKAADDTRLRARRFGKAEPAARAVVES